MRLPSTSRGCKPAIACATPIKVHPCTVPCDVRRSFDGLSMMAEHVMGCDPYAVTWRCSRTGEQTCL